MLINFICLIKKYIIMDSKPIRQQQLIIDSARMKLDVSIFPKHDPAKFSIAFRENLIDKVYESGDQIGFLIKNEESETFYELDDDFGYFEPNGCYYNSKNQPAGWWVMTKKGIEHFYNIEGYLEAIEDENEQKQKVGDENKQFAQMQFQQYQKQQFENYEK